MGKGNEVLRVVTRVQVLFFAAFICGILGFVGTITLRPMAKFLFYKLAELGYENWDLHPMFWNFDYEVIPFAIGALLFFVFASVAVSSAQRHAAKFIGKVIDVVTSTKK